VRGKPEERSEAAPVPASRGVGYECRGLTRGGLLRQRRDRHDWAYRLALPRPVVAETPEIWLAPERFFDMPVVHGPAELDAKRVVLRDLQEVRRWSDVEDRPESETFVADALVRVL